MLPLRRQILTFALGLAAGPGLPAAEWRLPPLSGELAGDFTPLNVPGTPKLHWKITAQPVASGDREITVTITGPGAKLRASARLDAAASGTWRIDEGAMDLAVWFPATVALLAQRSPTFTLAGACEMSGEGTIRDGQAAGRAVVRLRDASFDVPNRKVLLQGVALELTFEDLATWRTAPSQRLTWQGGKYGAVTLGAGRCDFSVAGDQVEVEAATIEVFAGKLSLGGFAFSFDQPDVDVTASVQAFEMAMLLPFLPNVVSEARGRVDGTILLHWGAEGVQIGDGQLALRTGETAELRFLPQPGFLAGSLPPTLTKYYTGLADLEQGKVPLKADRLEISLTPNGDAEGRNAVIRVAGGPVDPRLKAPVDLTFNVRAPIDWLVNFGTKLGSGR